MSKTKEKKPPRGPTVWPGLCTAARDLGCTYQHLALVLNGGRISKRLTARYTEWVKANPQIHARLPKN